MAVFSYLDKDISAAGHALASARLREERTPLVRLGEALEPSMAAWAAPRAGCHLNPAVGLTVAGRFPKKDLPLYVLAQVVGGILGALVLYVIASGKPGFDLAGGLAANGYGDHSPGHYAMTSGLVAEIVLTFTFLMIILGATDKRAPAGFAPIAIGLGLR